MSASHRATRWRKQRNHGRTRDASTKDDGSATHRDKLPHESKLPELPHKVLHIVISKPSGIPIKARAQIVREPLVGVCAVHAVRKLARLGKDRLLGLHPKEIRVRRERDGAVHRALGAALVTVVPLDGARCVPVPERRAAETKFSLRGGQRLGARRVCDARSKSAQCLRGRGRLNAQRIRERLAVELEPGLGEPFVLDGLQRVARRAALRSLVHDLDELTSIRVRTADDERVVARVDVARDERRGLGIGTRDDEALDAHDVELEPNRDESVDVLLDGDEHFARHVAALFRARCLVLDVNARRALFHEELREFHRCRKAAMARVGICYDRADIIDRGVRGELCIGHMRARFALLAVMEELSREKVFNLVRYSVVGIIFGDANHSSHRGR